MCAESQLDGTAEKCAVLVAVDELVKNKKTPDMDTIELYEWACRDFFDYDVEYADTLGPLRARWVKANPKNPQAMQCLQSCLEKWDLGSAQQVCDLITEPPGSLLKLTNLSDQIAATLDKAYANSTDRRCMFWNITLTFLLSVCLFCPYTPSLRKADMDRSAHSPLMPAANYTVFWLSDNSSALPT
jgi:hypothetical protein